MHSIPAYAGQAPLELPDPGLPGVVLGDVLDHSVLQRLDAHDIRGAQAVPQELLGPQVRHANGALLLRGVRLQLQY